MSINESLFTCVSNKATVSINLVWYIDRLVNSLNIHSAIAVSTISCCIIAHCTVFVSIVV